MGEHYQISHSHLVLICVRTTVNNCLITAMRIQTYERVIKRPLLLETSNTHGSAILERTSLSYHYTQGIVHLFSIIRNTQSSLKWCVGVNKHHLIT